MFNREAIKRYNGIDVEQADKSQYIIRLHDRDGYNLFYYCKTREEAVEWLHRLYEDKNYGDDYWMIQADGYENQVWITGFDW